jgi:hypothetical protein
MLAAFATGEEIPRAGPGSRTGDREAAVKNAPPAGSGAPDRPESGVLPAVTDRLRKLPESVPKPQVPDAPPSPPLILGAAALLLLAVSSLALLVYVVRFLRRPRAT